MPKKYRKRTLAEKRELVRLYLALPQGMHNTWLFQRKLSRSMITYWQENLPEEKKTKKRKKAA